MEKLNNGLLQLVCALKNDFEGLCTYTHKGKPSRFGESYVSITDEGVAEDLSKIFFANHVHTQTVINLVYQMDDLVNETISDDKIVCNRGWFPFLICSTFKHEHFTDNGRCEITYRTILASAFDIEDFNSWVDEETNFDFPTKEVLKLGVQQAYKSSERGHENGLDYAYLDVILYLIKFFESYKTHLENNHDNSK